jgi:hypothetical protein
MQLLATETVMKQAEMLANELSVFLMLLFNIIYIMRNHVI